jgi:ParB-like chromosome segregation protein Spo0J
MSDRPTIHYRGKTYTVLFPDLLRSLTIGEIAALTEDIRKNGVLIPVVVDEDNGIIDGINRLTLAGRLGTQDVPFDVRPGLSPQAKRKLALSLNVYRRLLSAKEFQELRHGRIQRVAEGRRQGKSIRTLAEEEEVSPGQVQRDLDAATVSGETVEPKGGKVTGRDGKDRPAARQKKATTSADEPTGMYREKMEGVVATINCYGRKQEPPPEEPRDARRPGVGTASPQDFDKARALRLIKDSLRELKKPEVSRVIKDSLRELKKPEVSRVITAVFHNLSKIQSMLEGRPVSEHDDPAEQ